MNQIITKCTEIILLNKPDIPEKIAIQAVHYVLSVAASLRRVTLTGLDEQEVPLNYYGITFGNSGRGKDLSASMALKMISKIIDKYEVNLQRKIASSISKGESISIPSIEHKDGTTAGFLQDRNTLDVLRLGSTNIRVEELISTLKSSDFEQVLNLLVESWQEGSNASRSFKSYLSPKINFVPANCLLYSSPEGFRTEGNKSFQSFIDILANGLARRSYVVFDESNVEFEEEPTSESLFLYAENIKKSKNMLLEMQDYLSLIVDKTNGKITFNIEAELEAKKYEAKNKNIVSNSPLMKNAVKAELLARAYKIRRLAGLYALFNGSVEVSISDIQDAIEWAEMLSKDLVIALNAETVAEKIYDYLEKVSRYSSQTDIIKYYKMNSKEFKENIDEVYTVAYDNGSALQCKVFDKEAKVLKYNLIKGKKTNPASMICSASNSMSDNFVQLVLSYNELPDLVKGKYGSNYSAGIFLNNKRCKDNYIKQQNLIIYDVDDEMTISDAMNYLEQYRGFISTTRNHNKEKNGLVCERFRIILISKFEFNLDHEAYKQTLTNFALFHNLNVDFPVIEPSRLYYAVKDTEITYLDGKETVDLRDYIPETKEFSETEKIIKHANSVYTGISTEDGFDKFFLLQTSKGNRNNNMLKFGLALMDKKHFSLEDAKTKVLWLNNMLLDPLPVEEIERTIFKTMSRK